MEAGPFSTSTDSMLMRSTAPTVVARRPFLSGTAASNPRMIGRISLCAFSVLPASTTPLTLA